MVGRRESVSSASIQKPNLLLFNRRQNNRKPKPNGRLKCPVDIETCISVWIYLNWFFPRKRRARLVQKNDLLDDDESWRFYQLFECFS
jgi:hypothetical protein